MDFRASLNLPDTDFTIPMKADLPQREPEMLAAWEAADLYGRIQEARRDAPTFVLHDGPAYTNSAIHVGHALNKILKDFVVKSKTMLGFASPYVPGYDNHGLPIELAVQKELGARLAPAELRKACRAHASKYVEVQTRQFRRLGVLGLWDRAYQTMAPAYEAELVRLFGRLVAAGFVYKGLRPTLWSTTSRTALADTEIVYAEHTSTAIYVRFPLLKDENGFSQGLPNVYAIIWTTTPWTIPANLALAFSPTAEYAIVRVGADHYILAADLVPKVAEVLGWTEWSVVVTELGPSFERSLFKHPVFDRPSLGVVADYVTTDEGTGIVHTAPGHGRDDFATGMRYGLPILTPVDAGGVLTAEAGEFAGVTVAECDVVVVDRLRELGNLLDARPYVHSYPHAERDGKPVIFRATEQWFIDLEHDDLRARLLAEADRVEWFPRSGHARISAMLAGRPDWCISRQRPWGVGIPVFYGAESGEPVLDPVAFEAVAALVQAGGSDAWFEADPAAVLPPGYVHPQTGETAFRKETDVLDVWFDSGASSLCVFDSDVDEGWPRRWPPNMVVEGSDQHRGWFNASLILATALRGAAPYSQVLTHGFITDETGRKMSKRLGNVVDPTEACATYGADVLRYWVASVDFTEDAPCSDGLLKSAGDHYRNVRNALRFLLANLYDHDPSAEPPSPADPLDVWAMEQTDLLVAEVAEAYDRYAFGAGLAAVHNFCRIQLSNFYLDVVKDRMYCDGADWPSRRSGQAACRFMFERLVTLLAPVLPFTAEEAWQRLLFGERKDRGDASAVLDLDRSIHLRRIEAPSADRLAEIEGSEFQARFAAVIETRAAVFAAFEAWKVASGTKDSQDAVATVFAEGATFARLSSFEPEALATLFKLSWVVLREGPAATEFAASEYLRCERSRLRRPDVEVIDGVALRARDRAVLLARGAHV